MSKLDDRLDDRIALFPSTRHLIRGLVGLNYEKDFGSKSVATLGSSSTAIKLTGHTKTSTLDKHYDIHDKDQIKEYAHKVADSFTWAKKYNS